MEVQVVDALPRLLPDVGYHPQSVKLPIWKIAS